MRQDNTAFYVWNDCRTEKLFRQTFLWFRHIEFSWSVDNRTPVGVVRTAHIRAQIAPVSTVSVPEPAIVVLHIELDRCSDSFQVVVAGD